MTTRRFAKVSLLVVSSVLVVAQASELRAADKCYTFGACAAGNHVCQVGGGDATVAVKMQGPSAAIKTASFHLDNPTLPELAAAKAARALCDEADGTAGGNPIECFDTGLVTCGTSQAIPITTALTCETALPAAGTGNVVCYISGVRSFNIRHFNLPRFSVLPCDNIDDPDQVQSFGYKGNYGSWIAADLLDSVLIRVDPDGAPGLVTFNAVGAPGPGPTTFQVNTNLGDTAFNGAVCNGFTAMGLVAKLRPAADIGRFLDPPSSGSFVEVTTPANVTEVGVKPETLGPNVTIQMDAVATGAGVPTLNEWGMGVLIAILLITGVWMLRRRQRLQQV